MTVHACAKKAALLFLVGCLALAGCGARVLTKSGAALNTTVSVSLYRGGTRAELDRCLELCREYEARFSRTLPESEIFRLNNRALSEVSADTAALVALSLDYGGLSGGALDITVGSLSALWDFTGERPSVPSPERLASALEHVGLDKVSLDGDIIRFSDERTQLDLGAVAKGYIADRLKDYLLSRGVRSAIINLGGNVLCIGGRPDGGGFRVGIQRPFSAELSATIEVSDLSVVTSGVYERYFEEDGVLYHHILDPATGQPSRTGLLSVTIISESSAVGDALSTACFVLGPERGMELADSLDGVFAIFIAEDGTLSFSKGLLDTFNVTY